MFNFQHFIIQSRVKQKIYFASFKKGCIFGLENETKTSAKIRKIFEPKIKIKKKGK